jgi:hypothetical protein
MAKAVISAASEASVAALRRYVAANKVPAPKPERIGAYLFILGKRKTLKEFETFCRR